MVNFAIVNQKLTGSSLHIEKNQTIGVKGISKRLSGYQKLNKNHELHVHHSSRASGTVVRL